MLFKLCLAAMLSTQTADLTTTLRLGPRFQEGNPFLFQSKTGAVLVKASATTALVWTGWRIRKTKPRLAVSMMLIGAVSGAVGAVHNVRLK